MAAKVRIEKDALGEKAIPAGAYYGINVARAIENFPISGVGPFPQFVEAFVVLKKACALANAELGLLDTKRADAIVRAADEVLSGKLREWFVVDVFQAGAGTSHNMNVNEVLANRANELLGGKRGDYAPVHPNDHVNYAQSTNDTFPTAMRIAARVELDKLVPAVAHLGETFAKKAREFDAVLKSARTHLQDAVPIRLGQEFGAYATTVRKHARAMRAAGREVEELGIGGSAAGTGLNTHPRYRALVAKNLSRLLRVEFRNAPDLCEAMQSHFPILKVAGSLRDYAVDLTRIANDLRLLASGPTTGFAEIVLPPVQAGSSIMPGKVNPVLAECANMVCFHVLGNDHAIALAAQAGQLELNVMMPVMIHNLLQSMIILTSMSRALADKCVAGIAADAARCRGYADRSMSLATALAPYIGYAKSAEIAKASVKRGRTVPEVAREMAGLPENDLARILDPLPMTRPGIPGRKLK
jgi:aspartate ammonia-lyase